LTGELSAVGVIAGGVLVGFTVSDHRVIIRRPVVRQRTGYSDSQRDRLEKKGEFPQRVQLGERAVGWYEDEVDQWIRARVRGRGRTLSEQHGGRSIEPPSASPAK
jgi:prophage regulatory protein